MPSSVLLGGTLKKHVHILPVPGTVTEWRECTHENIASVDDVEPDKSWNTEWMFAHGTRDLTFTCPCIANIIPNY
jgi:hypothetical protein